MPIICKKLPRGARRSAASRFLSLVAAALLLVCGLGAAAALSACQADETTVVSKKVESAISVFKNSSSAEESALIADNQNPFLGFGVSEQEAASSLLKNFSYELGDVAIDGDAASVTVHATNADITSVMQNVTQQTLGDAITTKAQESNAAEIQSMLSKNILDAMAADDAQTVSQDIVVNFVRDGESWDFSDPSQILQVLFAGHGEALNQTS